MPVATPALPTPARPAHATRARIVAAALELFDAQGYEATSLKQVATEAGVNGGSVFHFFPSKAHLVAAVLEQYLELLDPVLMAPVRAATADPVERVLLLLAGYRAHLVATGFSRGCPIGSLSLELADREPAARALVIRNFEAWRGAVAELLREADFREGVDVSSVAAFVLTVMEGAVMQARSYRSAEPFDASVRELTRYLAGLRRSGGDA
jgi:TetR/AcrR family transcriptional repressor of nem operon